MSPRDTSKIKAAIVAMLLSDTALSSLMPDGVYTDVAPHGKTNFVIVSLVIGQDVGMFQQRAYEDKLYLVKAVSLGQSAAAAIAAAARIDVLLDYGSFLIDGYNLMSSTREESIEVTEPDEVDTSIRWQHRGGRYRVLASPNP